MVKSLEKLFNSSKTIKMTLAKIQILRKPLEFS